MTGISFWNHRVERFWKEANGFGLLDPTGDSTERMQAASRIGRAIQNQGEFFAQSQPPRAQVALLVNEDLYHFFQACNGDVIHHYRYNLRGWYARLWRLGIAVDFVDSHEVSTGGLAPYDAAILTMPLSLDADYFRHLEAFVEAGGTLIAEACPGRWDKYGWCTVTQLVDGGEAFFGARHQGLVMVKEPDGGSRWMPGERRFGEFDPPATLAGCGPFAGLQVRANFYRQSLRPTTGEPILTFGSDVAGVVNRVGAGQSVLIGSFLGFSALAYRAADGDGDRFVEALLTRAGVLPDRCGTLLRRRRVLDDRQAWFFINPSSEPVTQTISSEGYTDLVDLLGDSLVSQSQDEITLRVPGT